MCFYYVQSAAKGFSFCLRKEAADYHRRARFKEKLRNNVSPVFLYLTPAPLSSNTEHLDSIASLHHVAVASYCSSDEASAIKLPCFGDRFVFAYISFYLVSHLV